MKVSILVPIYKVAPFIRMCAEALMQQTYADVEYIFVDDCSPDESVSILENVIARHPERKAKVQIVRHEQNRGLGAARLTGLEHATGEAIMFVDSDDSLSVDFVEQLVRCMEATGADMVDAPYALWDGEKTSSLIQPFAGRTDVYLRLLLCHNMESPHIWGRLYRRRLFTDHHIQPVEGIDYGEDLAVVPRLLYHARRACVDRGYYLYRTGNATSYTHTISERAHQSFLRANQLIFDFFLSKADAQKYSVALRMGFVDLYRHAARFRLSNNEINQMGDFWKACPGTRLCIWLYKKGCYPLATACYLLSRRVYREWLLLSNACAKN